MGGNGGRAARKNAGLLKRCVDDFAHMGYGEIPALFLISLIWFVVSLPVLTIPAATAGVFAATRDLGKGESARVGSVFSGMARYFVKTLPLVALEIVAVLFIGMQVLYWRSGGTIAPLFLAFDILLALGVCFLLLYFFPLLVRAEGGLRSTMEASVALAVQAPGFTLSVSAVSVGLFVILALPFWGVPFLLLGPVSGFLNIAASRLLEE